MPLDLSSDLHLRLWLAINRVEGNGLVGDDDELWEFL